MYDMYIYIYHWLFCITHMHHGQNMVFSTIAPQSHNNNPFNGYPHESSWIS